MNSLARKSFDLFVSLLTLKRRLRRELGVPGTEIDAWFIEASELSDTITGSFAGIGLRIGPLARCLAMQSMLRGQALYVLYRAVRPRLIVETGVGSGTSAFFALHALDRNKSGRLISIDLPNQEGEQIPGRMPVGWLVPDHLKKNWDLRLGPSQELLPEVCRTEAPMDVFFHDSLHTREHMLWEFRTAWPRLKQNGILAADDISMNSAFDDFCAEVRSPCFKTYHRFGWIHNRQRAE